MVDAFICTSQDLRVKGCLLPDLNHFVCLQYEEYWSLLKALGTIETLSTCGDLGCPGGVGTRFSREQGVTTHARFANIVSTRNHQLFKST